MINHLITQKNWQTQLSEAITSIDELLHLLKLESLRADVYVPKHFELRVPRDFVAKMRVGDHNDPLLKQVLPDQREQINVTGYVADPLSEKYAKPSQRYATQIPVKGIIDYYGCLCDSLSLLLPSTF